MKTSEDLFNLIQSLSRNEKRYFRKFTALHVRGKQNKYLVLFDAIVRQKHYDEEQLKKQFCNEPFTRQLTVVKNYLYHQILKSLRSYHKSIYSEMKDLMRNAEILFEKGLYSLVKKTLRKVQQIAYTHEMWWAVFEALYWKERLMVHCREFDSLDTVLREKRAALSLYQNTQAYRNINYKISSFYHNYGIIRSRKQNRALRRIMENKLLRKKSLALTHESKFYFYEIWGFYWFSKGNTAKASYCWEKLIQDFHKHPEKIPVYFQTHIVYLANLIGSELHAEQYQKAEQHLALMKEGKCFAKNRISQSRFYYLYNNLLLDFFLRTGHFLQAADHVPAILKEYETYQVNLSELEKATILFNIAYSYFGIAQYHKSIFYFNKVRNEIKLSINPDIQSSFHLFNLIVNYEAGKTDLLPYLILSCYRFLKKREQLYAFEKIVLVFLKKELPRAVTRKKLLHAFEKLRTQLLPLKKDPYERNAFFNFDYISWLESKIENRPFTEVVREKAKTAVIHSH